MAAPEPTIGEVLLGATDQLRAAGSSSPRLDAEVLLAHVLGRERTWLLAHPDEPVPRLGAFRSLVERRAAGVPVAYLRGGKEWRSLRILTDARALSPRPETELLVEAALDELDRRLLAGPVVAWEVATGSGAVTVALAVERAEALRAGRLRLIASDLSTDALALAAENLAEHRVAELVELHHADLLEPAGMALPRPDLVVANLPYVPSAELDAAGPFLAHEPRMALDGGADGLDVIRRLLADLPGRVAPGATILLEVGAGHADAVASLAPAAAAVEVVADLAGVGRVVRIGMAHS